MTKPQRPLPQPGLSTEPYWTSGSDGLLRIPRCTACGKRTMPPLPICPSCGGRRIEMEPVSGRGVVAAFTINAQQWLPGFDPPYVIAIVALEEDDSVRITTNIVGCPVTDVHIGLRVRVVFEHAEDVWIPLFELDPDANAEPGPVPEPRDYRSVLRPMATSRKFEDQVALTGVGQSRVGRRLMVDPLSLTVDACLEAIADAGLDLSDIDGLSTYPGPQGAGMTEGGVSAVEEALRIHPTWVNGASETPGQIGSIITAMMAVSSGLVKHVLCFRTVWEASLSHLQRSGRWHMSDARATGAMMEFRMPYGAASAANWIGMQAQHYFWRYGLDREVLGHIAVNARANAGNNPEAIYRDPISMDDYLSARMVSTPLGLYDCDVPVDGAIAVVVSAIDTIADRPRPPVFVEAVGTQILERVSWDQDTLTHLPQSLGPSAHLWSRTSLRHDDVDVALLYDGFTFNALSWLEGLGFCELGGAADFIDGGRGIALDGRLPLNPHGGQLSAGRTHGYGFVREAMLQLRDEADGRQVQGADVAVVSAGGGIPSGAMLLRRG